jgi:hypothetical protein
MADEDLPAAEDQLPPDERPQAAISERALSLVNEAMFTIDLQCRRIRTVEPEDERFVMRWWADLQFLIVALRRIHRAASLGLLGLPETCTTIRNAIQTFEGTLPGLAAMRNVGEHIDDYVVGAGHQKNVDRAQLQVGSFDGTTYEWLDRKLNIDDAQRATDTLYLAVRSSIRDSIRQWRVQLWKTCRLTP